MRRFLAPAAGVVAFLAAATALPCGAAFGPSIKIDPQQDIVLVWKDNIETYVFQPTFCGTATDFGLILPVAATVSQNPTVVDQQAFTTAKSLSEPNKRIVNQPSGGIGCGGGSSLGGSKNAGPETTVVASGRVGLLDWVQLKADTTTSFTDWLTANGYPYSSTSANAFSYYVEKGWYFLAFRISQEAAADGTTVCRALGPIALSFPTPEPVVPSRMAMASSSYSGGYASFYWRIFGITRGDAELAFADGANADRELWYSGAILAADAPGFSGLAEPGDRLTRLTLRFTYDLYNPSTVPADIGLTTTAPHDFRGTEDVYVYDDSACSVSGSGRLPHGSALTMAGLALLGLLCWRRWR